MTTKIKIIGIIGNSGSGKDTIGDHIKKNYNGVGYAFANPIKELTRTLFLFDDDQLYGSKKEIIDERWGITPRQSWQTIGTNIMQFSIYGFLPDLLNKVPVRKFWTYHFHMWYNKFSENPENETKIVVVTDVRFQHEADTIKKLGGTLIKIDRPDLDTTSIVYKHPSETSIIHISSDVTITNDGTVADLYKHTDDIMILFEKV
jgi:hypothetical protein